MKHMIFISYSREDSEFTYRLAADLRDHGVPVWLDVRDIPPGEKWDRAIEDALRVCNSLLIVLSPTALHSEHVMNELRYALEESKQILPVLHKQCPLPLGLVRFNYVDFTRRENYSRSLRRLLAVWEKQAQHTGAGWVSRRRQVISKPSSRLSLVAAVVAATTVGGCALCSLLTLETAGITSFSRLLFRPSSAQASLQSQVCWLPVMGVIALIVGTIVFVTYWQARRRQV